MNRRSPMVDFGPLALPVAAWPDPGIEPSGGGRALASEALRLQQLVAAGSHTSGPASGMAAMPATADAESNPAISGLLAHSTDAMHAAACGAAAALSAEAGRVTGLRLELQSEWLPSSTVVVEASEGSWLFGLHVGDPNMRDWLAGALDLLAAELGPRLGRSLELRLFEARVGAPLIRAARWQVGSNA